MATAQQVIQKVCWDLCEDSGLVLGLIATQQVIDYLNQCVDEYLRCSCLIQRIYTVQIQAGVPYYTVPDCFVRVDSAYVAGRYLPKTTQREMNASRKNWRRVQGQPVGWYMDGLPQNTIGLAPTPIFNGQQIIGPNDPNGPYGQFDTFSPPVRIPPDPGPDQLDPIQQRNLTIVGPCTFSQTNFYGDQNLPVVNPTDPIPLLPDDFALSYLPFRVLERIFSPDSEQQDKQKAAFCGAQWKEGQSVAAAITGEYEDSRR